jgi:F0F1-type ATP synthase membrane subunit b/b'
MSTTGRDRDAPTVISHVKAKEESKEIISTAEEHSKRIIEATKSKAERRARDIIAAAEKSAGDSISMAKKRLSDEYANLVFMGVEEIIKRDVDRDSHSSLIDSLKVRIANDK